MNNKRWQLMKMYTKATLLKDNVIKVVAIPVHTFLKSCRKLSKTLLNIPFEIDAITCPIASFKSSSVRGLFAYIFDLR